MRYVAPVQDINVEVLADSGASDNFLSLHIATQAHLKLIELDRPTSATLANGSSLQIRHLVKDVPVQIGDYVRLVDFKVMSMSSLSMVLGKPWFNDADPHVSWKQTRCIFVHPMEISQLHPKRVNIVCELSGIQLDEPAGHKRAE
jgi:hypothetical protein